MDEKVIVNCTTHKEIRKDLTVSEQAQRVTDEANDVKLRARMEREKKIGIETRRMATDSLIAKNEIEPE